MVEVSQNGDSNALQCAIYRVAKAAGLDGGTHHRSDSDTGLASFQPSISTEKAIDLHTRSPSNVISSSVEVQPASMTQAAASVTPDDLRQQQSSCMSFRLDCGLFAFPTSASRILDPPLDIAPYLGPNQHTLAAQIYWYCTETTVSLVYHLTGHDPRKMALAAQHHPVLAAMLRYVSTACSYNYLLALAEARLEFYRLGSCKADNLAATRDSALLLRQCVEKEHGAELEDFGEWLTSNALARMVEERLTGCALRRLQAAMRNDDTDVAARKHFNAFIHSVWLGSTCFGDGPRWKESYIDERTAWLVQALSKNNRPISSAA